MIKMQRRQDLEPRHHSGQLSLFSTNRDEFTADVMVSYDEMSAWHQKNWLSFAPCTISEFNEPERMEVLFLRGLARSGLSDAYIDKLLKAGLQKPYCYDPCETFYSFGDQCWISVPPEPDPADITEEYIDELAELKEWDKLRELQNNVAVILEAADQPSE